MTEVLETFNSTTKGEEGEVLLSGLNPPPQNLLCPTGRTDRIQLETQDFALKDFIRGSHQDIIR